MLFFSMKNLHNSKKICTFVGNFVSSVNYKLLSYMTKIEWKAIGATFFYALIWGTGLFFSTFFSVTSDFSFLKLFQGDLVQTIIGPSCVVLALFLWEEAEGVERKNLPLHLMKKQLKYNFIVLGIILILFACIGLTTGYIQLGCLILGWICITAIKFISKHYSDLQIEINKL